MWWWELTKISAYGSTYDVSHVISKLIIRYNLISIFYINQYAKIIWKTIQVGSHNRIGNPYISNNKFNKDGEAKCSYPSWNCWQIELDIS